VVLPELGVSGGSVEYGAPGLLANATTDDRKPVSNGPWLEYDFETHSSGQATLALYLLPTFPVDSQHRLRYAVRFDSDAPTELDASGSGEWREKGAEAWADNVLRNYAAQILPLGEISPGRHTLRLFYIDPGVVLQHLTIMFPSAPPAYPMPSETEP